MSHEQLPPLPAPVAVFPQFIAQRNENLVIREKLISLTGDSFDIKNTEGVPVFKVAGKAMSLSGRKVFCDAQGNEMFHLRKEHFHLHATFYAEEEATKKRFFEVKSKFSIGSSKAEASFSDANGTEHKLLMKGNWLDSKAAITDATTGVVVATINRKWFTAGEFFGDQQTYVLSVAPGMDMALMCAACICFDEANNEKK